MKYAEGGELDPSEIVGWADVESVLLQVLDAVAHVHARSRIRPDIKPENILRTAQGRPWRYRLADFGIARITTEFSEPHL